MSADARAPVRSALQRSVHSDREALANPGRGPYSMTILERINSPADLKQCSISELNTLAGEIRQELIDVVSENGGHLGANLGTVELTIALHYVFDSPRDLLVWDVGHQAYIHKLLTGRRDRFDTI